tara:strand:- start:2808 stop:3257 length:450 start_codon:yes stop_codon:yes gene_type:complete
MAVIDKTKTKKPFLEDRDDDVFIGLDYPLYNGERGMFTPTTTVLEATKHNIRNLLLTELGERVMQPTLGVRLKRYLFEPFTSDIQMAIKNNIIDTFSYWLPYIAILELTVGMSESTANIENNQLNIFVKFGLNKDPKATESVQVTIGDV